MSLSFTALADRELTPLPLGQRVDTDEEPCVSNNMILHTSCASCKHFNKHRNISISHDQSRHARIACERCGYNMMGFGRSSTQTTLASVDSLPMDTQNKPHLPIIRFCTTGLPQTQADRPFHQETQPQLAPLIEQSPLLQSSQSPTEVKEQESDRPRTSPSEGSREAGIVQSQMYGAGESPYHHEGPSLKSRHPYLSPNINALRALGRRCKDRIRQFKMRIATIHKSGKDVIGKSLDLQATHKNIDEPFVNRLEPFDVTSVAQPDESKAEAPIDIGTKLPPDASIPSSAPLQHCNEDDGTTTSALTSKCERLKRFRRMKTLQNQATVECKCEPECFCSYNSSQHLNSGRATNGSSCAMNNQLSQSSNGDTDEFQEVCSCLYTSNIGCHLPSPRISLEIDASSSTAYGSLVGDSMSEAATQVESDESMHSQHTSRHSSLRPPSSSGTQGLLQIPSASSHFSESIGLTNH